jgi:L-iditol 2-dehydrogenase
LDIAAYAAEITDGKLFDVVIEAAGTEAAFYDALLLAGYASRLGMVGLARREPFDHGLWTVIDREQTIIGVRGSPHVYPQTIDLIVRGALRPRPLISHVFTLSQYREAFAVAAKGGPEVMKVLLTME